MPFQGYHFDGEEKSVNYPTLRHLLRQLLQGRADEILKRGVAVAAGQHLLDDVLHVGGFVAEVHEGREGVVHEFAGGLVGLRRAGAGGRAQLVGLVPELQSQARGRFFADAGNGGQRLLIVGADGRREVVHAQRGDHAQGQLGPDAGDAEQHQERVLLARRGKAE